MTDRRFIDELISAANEYRAMHQVEPLKHNAVISTVSQSWADRLARTGAMEHNPNRSFNGQPLGENIAMKWSSNRQDYTGQQAVDQWYDEIKKYDFSRHSGQGTGHFTQLVWKSSREIGVGRAQSRDGKWFVVTNYFPAGNYVGRDAENVFPVAAAARNGKPSSSTASPRGVQATVVKETTKPSAFSRMLSPFRASSPSSAPPNDSPTNHGRSADQPRVQLVTSKHQPETIRSAAPTTIVIEQSRPAQEVVLERRQETRTKNGVTTTTITETRRDADGRVKTVTKETVEPATGSTTRFPAAAAGGNSQSGAFREMSLHFNTFGLNEPDSQRLHPSSSTALKQQTFVLTSGEKARNGATGFVAERASSATPMATSASNDREFASQVVGDLKLNVELSQTAERWARHLAGLGRLEHSNSSHSRTGEPLGENIAFKYSSIKEGYTGVARFLHVNTVVTPGE